MERIEMKMPAKYVELSEEEMEYDGGWVNFAAALIVSGIGMITSIVGAATGNDTLMMIGTVCTVAGLALTGIGACSAIGTIFSGTATAAQVTAAGINLASYATIGVLDPMVNTLFSKAVKS